MWTIALILYLLVALFMSCVLVYELIGERDEQQIAGDELPNYARFALAFLLPILWPFMITMMVVFFVEDTYKSKQYTKARKVMRSIGNDNTRLNELSLSDLKLLYRTYRKEEHKAGDLSKVEQELLNRMIEQHLL